MIEGQHTTDPELLTIRRAWNCGLTQSKTVKRLQERHNCDKKKVVAEWRKMKRLFGCGCASMSYVNGWRESGSRTPTDDELLQPISNFVGGRTYGEWAGIIGPGKQLRESIVEDFHNG